MSAKEKSGRNDSHRSGTLDLIVWQGIRYRLATANWARPEMDDLAVLTRVTKVY